jgi:hypothetical protein
VQVPSVGRLLVELQKGVTQLHRAGMQSPLAPLLRGSALHEFLVLETTGRRSGARRSTPLSFTTDGDAFVVIASNGGAAATRTGTATCRTIPTPRSRCGERRSRSGRSP